MRREKKDKGYIVAFGFTKRAHDQVARAKAEGLGDRLVKV